MRVDDELILKKDISLKCIQVHTTIARSKKCAYPRPIILLLNEHPDFSAELVAEKLLCNVNLVYMASEWIKRVQRLRLIEEDDAGRWNITEDGKKYLMKNECLVPQEGDWRIWYSLGDRRVPYTIVDVTPIDTSDPKNWKERDDLKDVSPRELKSCIGKNLFELLTSKGCCRTFREEIRIDVIPSKFLEIPNKNRTLKVEWNVDEKRVTYSYNNLSNKAESLPEWAAESKEELIDIAFKSMVSTLDLATVKFEKNDVIRVPYSADFSDDVKRNMKLSSSIENTEAGNWDPVKLDYTLVPKTKKDADEWAMWLYADNLNDYLTDAKHKELIVGVQRKIENCGMNLESKSLCIKRIWDVVPASNWKFVQAALDWKF